MSYARKVDSNQRPIVHTAEQLGMVFIDLHVVGMGVFDGIICWRGQKEFIEFKNPDTSYGKKGLNPKQKALAILLAKVGVTVHKIETEDELFELMGVTG